METTTSEPTITSRSQSAATLPIGVLLALLVVYLVWGSTYLAISFAIDTLPPLLMSGVRFTLAGTLLFVILRLRGAALPSLREWRNAAIIGGLLLVGGNGMVVIAEQWVSSNLAALVVATTPLWAALFSGLWGQWPTTREWAGMGLGISGVLLLTLGSDLIASPLGAALLLIATISWSFGTVLGLRLKLPAGLMASAAEMLSAGIILSLLGLLRGERLVAMPSTGSLLAFGYLVLIGGLLAFSAFTYLMRRARPAVATSYAYVNPVVAVVLGATLGGETITPATIGALALIVAGVLLVVLRRNRGA